MLKLMLALIALGAFMSPVCAQKKKVVNEPQLQVAPPSSSLYRYRRYYRTLPRPLHPTVLPAEPSRQEGPWSIYDEIDKLDGSKSLTMTTRVKESGVEGHLAVRCLKNLTEVYVVWPDNVGQFGATVKWRADAMPVRTEWWRSATTGVGAFSPVAIPTVNLLFDKTEMVLTHISQVRR